VRSMTCVCVLLVGVFTACGGSGAASQDEAKKLAGALKGEDQVPADANPACRLYTPAELATFVGAPLAPGETAAMGTGCQWTARSGSGSAMIQVVPARYHEPHKGAQGFKKLPDVGQQGFVEMSMGGWNAGAITGPQAVVVALSGPAASEATAIAFLKDTIKRRAK
jgi:hypothetical protein